MPSGPCMTNFQIPPGLTSIACVVVVKPTGPHHCARCFGSVQASKTSSRGASKVRVNNSWRSAVSLTTLALAVLTGIFLLLGLQLAQIFFEAVEALFPKPSIVLHPICNILERSRVQTAGSPLSFAPARNQASILEHLQVFRYGRHTHVERLR